MGGSSFLKDVSLQNMQHLRQHMTDDHLLTRLWEVLDPLVLNEALFEIKDLENIE